MQAQEDGYIPWDEPLDPTMVATLDDSGRLFPLWLSAEPLRKIQALYEKGVCRDPAPSQYIGIDIAGIYRGIAWVVLSDGACAVVESAARPQEFPVSACDLLSELLPFEVCQEVESILSRRAKPVSVDHL